MEAVRTSETSAYFNENTRRYIPESCHIGINEVRKFSDVGCSGNMTMKLRAPEQESIKRRDQEASILATYSGGQRFKSGSGDRLLYVRILVVFLDPFLKVLEWYRYL
jgi:hypothetical protein